MVKKWLMIAALSAVAFTPATASADWLFTPNMGAAFGGATSGTEHFTYGASIGWMGAGIFGWEADLAYTPEFFEGDDDDIDFIDGSNVTTAMFNAIIGAPVGGQSDRASVRISRAASACCRAKCRAKMTCST